MQASSCSPPTLPEYVFLTLPNVVFGGSTKIAKALDKRAAVSAWPHTRGKQA